MIPEEPFDRDLRRWFDEAAVRAPDRLLLAVVDQTRMVRPVRRWLGLMDWRTLPRLWAFVGATAAIVIAAGFGLSVGLPGVGTAPTPAPSAPATIDVTFFVHHRWAEPATIESAGSFQAFGAFEDSGVFSATIRVLPDATYEATRTLYGRQGTIEVEMTIRSTIELATSETVSGTFRIVGGTGRYEGLTGSGDVRTGIGPQVEGWPVGTFPERWQGSIEGGPS